MADLVVGLAKSVVEGALTKAQAAIEEEAKLRQSAQRDLVFITGEIEMMHSFLNVANEERVENKVVRTWVRQVRELAYDVEDCIEFVVHLDKKNTWWFRMIPSCMAPAALALALDEAVDEIEQLKARVEDVSKRNARYNLISDSGSKPVVMQQQPAPGAVGGATASNMLIEARDAAKRRQRFGDLTRLITKKDNNDLQVISVWGAGGDHGTTSIIRKTYNDPEICKNFTYRSWVKLMHPFNPHEFIRSLMTQFYANSFKEQTATVGMQVLTKMEATKADLFKEFEELVTEKRYLVVLEGLSSMVEWDYIRTFLPHREKGSCIIVSAQQSEIASLCIGHPYQILELKQFSAEHSVCALFKGSQGDQDKYKKPMDSQGHGDKGRTLILMAREESLESRSSYDNILSPNKEEADRWMKNFPLVGREAQMSELNKYPAKARVNSPSVMSVWGIAGVGKSALVRNLYYDRMLDGRQFDKYGWVDVSHPFNLRDFHRSLLSDFQSDKDPIAECHHLVKDHRCLIVIDDLRSTEEWDMIQAALVSKHSKSVIIAVTTDASIATYCTNNEELVFNVKALEAAAAFDLFKKQVHKKNPSSPLKVNKDMEELILRCGGLPKVIGAIASLLATQTVTWMHTVHSLNTKFMHHLETNLEYDSLRDLFRWMHSYFRTCPDSLKPCIIYLSIFPREHIIRRRRLVRRWIAEGYSRDSHNESAEENGEEHFSELLDLSIIQQPPQLLVTMNYETRRLVLCQVNGFIREYIVSRRMEENLVFELGGKCALTTQRTGRHLIILEDWDRDRIVFESIDFSRLRSLTVFGKWETFFISESMKMLRVLDLEDASGCLKDSDLDKVVELLRRLKFLSLRGHSEICRLPTSLGDLRQLQTLDVRHTSIVVLPASITELEKLQYIRAGTTVLASTTSSCSWPPFPTSRCLCRRRRRLAGVEVPRGIGKLTALHTLGVVNVGASGGKAMMKELMKLTQLRKLGVSGINGNNSNKLFSAISAASHGHLESLSVQLDKGSQGCLDDNNITLRWESLESLKLYGLGDKLPAWSNQLSNLTKLDLEMDTLTKTDIESLGKLPKLCSLRLGVQQLRDGKIHFYAEMYEQELRTYEKVKVLEIACSSSRLQVTFGSKTMKSLELLKLDSSAGSEYPLYGLDHLSQLKQVLLKGTDDEALKTSLQNQLTRHPKRPLVKLEELPRSS